MKKIEKSKLLIVEGKDEEEIFTYWYDQLNINEVQVLQIEGKSNLRENLGLLKNDSNFSIVESIGIIRDADEDSDAAFKSVCSALKNNGLSTPSNQKIYSSGQPKIKILIASTNSKKGALESYFINSVSENKNMICVDQYFECIKKEQGTIPHESKLDIAKTYVYMASNPAYSRMRLSHSVKSGHWDLSHDAFKDLKSFIETI